MQPYHLHGMCIPLDRLIGLDANVDWNFLHSEISVGIKKNENWKENACLLSTELLEGH